MPGHTASEDFGNKPEDHGLPTGQFDGDFFGSYAPDDFGYIDSDDEGNIPLSGSEEEEDDESDEDVRLDRAESAHGYEAPRPAPAVQQDVSMPGPESGNINPVHAAPTRETRKAAEDRFHHKPIVEKFPGGLAGKPISTARNPTSEKAYESSLKNSPASNPYAPFASKMDWEVARWAKLRGAGSTAFSDLLNVEGVRDSLNLSYSNSVQLNKIIDEQLPGRPKFVRSEVIVNGEAFPLYSRDILECVRALWGDSEFAPYLFVAPERHYIDKDKTIRMYHNMHTGKWWWSTQAAVEKDYPGATIVPIIISSDKTQLTVFGNKTAYPVYMTLGNIPKEIRRKPSRRGYVLLGYLPTSKMKNIKNKAARRRILANVFHACMAFILAPLKGPGGTGMQLISGDGITRRGHPIYATFVGDYPEQCLVTAVKTGECPTCEAPRDRLGEETLFPLRDLENILAALDTLDAGPTIYAQACADAGIKPVYHPFWEGLPYTNIFRAITPDILHQLYQGIVKHLIAWLKAAYGEAELDARCRRLPPNHNIRLFMNGISDLNRVTGKEHDQISRFILGIIIDIQLPNNLSPVRLIASNKSIFVDLGVRPDFNLPKLHNSSHIGMYIKLFGTTDNYNTEYTERLHIDLAKDAYRATNFKDEFPQMTLWLERKEKIFRHEKYIQWRLDGSPAPPTVAPLAPGIVYERRLKMTKGPTCKAVRMDVLVADYGALLFRSALARFIVQFNNPTFSRAQIEGESRTVALHFNRVPVYHRIKFVTEDPYTAGGPQDSVVDSIHVQPQKTTRSGKQLAGRFDTALVNDGSGGMTGISGYRIAQVRVVFSLKPHHTKGLFAPEPEPHHLMYKPAHTDGMRSNLMADVFRDPFRAPARTPSAQSPPPAQQSAPRAAPPLTSDPTGLTDEAPPVYTAGPDVYQGESTVDGSGYAAPPQHPQSTGWAPQQQAPSLWQQLTGATSPSQGSSGWSSYPGHQQYAPPQQPPQIHAPPPPPTTHVSEFARDFYATTSVPPGGFSDVSGVRATADASTAGYPPPAPSSSPYQPPSGPPPPPSPGGPPDDGRPTRTPVPGHPLLRGGSMLVYPPHFECAKCNNTGYKHADPGHPCHKCWERYARPYAGPLVHAPAASAAPGTQAHASLSFQRPLPRTYAPAPALRQCVPTRAPAPARDLTARRRAPQRRAVLAVQWPQDRVVPRVRDDAVRGAVPLLYAPTPPAGFPPRRIRVACGCFGTRTPAFLARTD
ncbi:hypothetical protein B0H17DRAFT_1215342 [Mycena rosella]|uniref:Uncharacterized protein n=1 Tax=Mycena rosella TaxID=1033263 RepID=A0AAD7CI16_MYCRO|nr:hypothetical protein B0H17DRAFT_1215342 [Mycena rosella]